MNSKVSWSLARAPLFLAAIVAALIGANVFLAALNVPTVIDRDHAASEKFGKVKAELALALTIPDHPNEPDDGLLQASEVSQLKLNADWFILSACDTASADSRRRLLLWMNLQNRGGVGGSQKARRKPEVDYEAN